MSNWYENLQRPPLTPPGWIFGPVWTVLYIMITVSLILFFISSRGNGFRIGTVLLITFHLTTNFLWTLFFFRLESPGLALIDILLLDLSLILMIIIFWQTSRIASVLLWPYLLWVLFATYLNAGFFILNRN